MPRGVPNKKPLPSPLEGNLLSPLETTLDEIRSLLEARRAEYSGSVERITEILQSLTVPTPRIGRPPKQR